MNFRHTILIIILIVQFGNLTAQKKIIAGLEMGYGTYEMTQNKVSLENTMRSNLIKPQCVQNFPEYVYFRPFAGLGFRHLNIGISYNLMSTGARYSIYDYSGDYRFDSQVVGNTGALFVEIPVYTISSRFKFLIAAESGIIFNKMKLEESFHLKENHEFNFQNELNLKSQNLFFKPYLIAEYKVWKSFSSSLTTGYHKNINEKYMQTTGDKSTGTEFIADWDGLRVSIGISFHFN